MFEFYCLVYWFEKGLWPKARRFIQYIIIFPVLYVEEKVYFTLYHFTYNVPRKSTEHHQFHNLVQLTGNRGGHQKISD